jgi:hypothetical protein
MRTNSPAQQTTRRMTSAAKAAMMQQRIADSYRDQEAHIAEFRAKQAFWRAAHAAGLSEAELHALDMELAHGADVDSLRASLSQF